MTVACKDPSGVRMGQKMRTVGEHASEWKGWKLSGGYSSQVP